MRSGESGDTPPTSTESSNRGSNFGQSAASHLLALMGRAPLFGESAALEARLERKLSCDLHVAITGLAGDLTERGRGGAGIGPVPIGMVERVVLFPAELELCLLGDIELFIDGRVEIPIAGTVVGIAHALRVERAVGRR